MPITIEDCSKCGILPDWAYNDIGWAPPELIIHCVKCGEEVANFGLEDTIHDWNEMNDPRRIVETPEDEE
jgi:hypothetical protein